MCPYWPTPGGMANSVLHRFSLSSACSRSHSFSPLSKPFTKRRPPVNPEHNTITPGNTTPVAHDEQKHPPPSPGVGRSPQPPGQIDLNSWQSRPDFAPISLRADWGASVVGATDTSTPQERGAETRLVNHQTWSALVNSSGHGSQVAV
ncbi:hypothetical protein Bbelb_112530 [Branchiostoma belcheri]|nr:hypothetical protein Bbelb_112530 [Branchiostoma belcheri]